MTARPRGAALLLVMWLLLLMAGLIAVFALTARTEALQGSALRLQFAARNAAEAGIEMAAYRLVSADPAARWVPDGRANEMAFEDWALRIEVHDEAGKFDLNVADVAQLDRLMQQLGLDASRAGQLSGAIQDWRDEDSLVAVQGGAEDRDYEQAGLPYGAKDLPITTLTELQQVLGMDLATYRLLVPHVTVHTAAPQPEPAFASLPVLIAMGFTPDVAAAILAAREAWQPGLPPPLMPDGTPMVPMGSGTYSVASRATRPDGLQVEITATVRIGAGSGFGQLYAPLAWRAGEPD